MLTVKIMNEFLHSPIWTYEDGIVTDDPSVISNDQEIQTLAKQVEEIYSSYYEFDSHDEACWFNKEKEYADRFLMHDLLVKITDRLGVINDGSFVVEPIATEVYRHMCEN